MCVGREQVVEGRREKGESSRKGESNSPFSCSTWISQSFYKINISHFAEENKFKPILF